MTRHSLVENFESRDVMLAKGELVILLDNVNDRTGDKPTGYSGYQSGLDRIGALPHVMVKTRHGRKVRIPRSILSKEIIPFNCQLCPHPRIDSYRDYVDHLIDKHLRVQLLKGLDMSKKIPICPFPSCHGNDNILL